MNWFTRLFSAGKVEGGSNPQLKKLLAELAKSSALIEVQGCVLPEESIVKKIGALGDPSAVPALKEARTKATLYRELMKFSSTRVNPMSVGSGSIMMAELLASQTINTFDEVIAKLERVPAPWP